MDRRVTTALDVLGVLLVAAGIAAGLWSVIGATALVPAGVIILLASFVSALRRERAPADEPPADEEAK